MPRLSKTRAAPPMEETKNPPQQGENPVKINRFEPGKMEPARSPAPMLRLLYRPARWSPKSTGPKKSPSAKRLIR